MITKFATSVLALSILFSVSAQASSRDIPASFIEPWFARMGQCQHKCYVHYEACRAACHGGSERECQNKCADVFHQCEAVCH